MEKASSRFIMGWSKLAGMRFMSSDLNNLKGIDVRLQTLKKDLRSIYHIGNI